MKDLTAKQVKYVRTSMLAMALCALFINALIVPPGVPAYSMYAAVLALYCLGVYTADTLDQKISVMRALLLMEIVPVLGTLIKSAFGSGYTTMILTVGLSLVCVKYFKTLFKKTLHAQKKL